MDRRISNSVFPSSFSFSAVAIVVRPSSPGSVCFLGSFSQYCSTFSPEQRGGESGIEGIGRGYCGREGGVVGGGVGEEEAKGGDGGG